MLNFRLVLPIVLFCGEFAMAQKYMPVVGQQQPGDRMQMKKSGVPTYPLYSKKEVRKNGKNRTVYEKFGEIPKLNVGREGAISASNLDVADLPKRPRLLKNGIKVPTKPTRDITIKPLEIQVASEAKSFKQDTNSPPKVALSLEKIEVTPRDIASVETASLQNLQEFSPSRLKFLQGLIFLQEVDEFPLAMGLFAELKDDKEVGEEAQYYLGLTALKVGLQAEFRKRMLKLVKNEKSPMRKLALERLMENIPPNDFHLANEILPHIEKLLGKEISDKPRFSLVKAKLELEKEQLKSASEWLERIGDNTPEAHERRYLQAVIAYRSGQGEVAREDLTQLLTETKGVASKKNLRSLASLTLARLHFQIGEYQKAYDAYLEVDKLHPLWMESLVEQAWSQILAKDYVGAAGNMFSLHTDLFKGAFQPESHITRTVAYVNLCQYGDALTVLKSFKTTYTPAYNKLMSYKKSNKGNSHYYELVKSFLRTDKADHIQGLPTEFLFEFARHPQFIGLQGEINSLEEERETLNKVYANLIDVERIAIKETTEIQKSAHKLRQELISTKKESKKTDLEKRLEKLERKVLGHKIKRYIANKSRTAMKELREDGIKYLAKEEDYYRGRASTFLAARYDQIASKLKYFLDQGDLLQYEIFSGAGEHLRYQLAGGDIKDTDAKPVQVAEDESMKWKFKGEMWEDEVGFFRSSLKNVCPPDDVAKNH